MIILEAKNKQIHQLMDTIGIKAFIFAAMEKEKIRLDKYLWSIRLFKTRSQAADACDKGKVKFNGDNVKAARTVNIGDEYDVKTESKRWVIKVTGLLDHRLQYSEAVNYYSDITPPEEVERLQFQA